MAERTPFPVSDARNFVRAYVHSSGRQGLVAGVLVGCVAFLEGMGLAALIPILQIVIAPQREGGYLGPVLRAVGADGIKSQLIVLLAAFLLIQSIRVLTAYARDTRLARLQVDFEHHHRSFILRRVAEAPWASISGLRHARIQSLLNSDVPRTASAMHQLQQAVVATMLILVQLLIALFIAPLLALLVIVMTAIAAAALLLVRGADHVLGAKVVGHHVKLQSNAAALLSGLKSAFAEDRQSWFVAEFEAAQQRLSRGMLEFNRRQSIGRGTFGFGSAVLGAVTIFAGVEIGADPATLIGVVVLFVRISGPTLQLQQSLQNFAFALPSYSSILALDTELGTRPPPKTASEEIPDGALELRDATYEHKAGSGIRDVSLTLEVGAFVGIEGPSGAGKTTLVDLMTGLLVPQHGALLVGGSPLDEAGRTAWRARLSYLAQEGFLFHDSVRRNLTWSSETHDEESLWWALDVAGVGGLVRGLPAGLETVIGERGTLLSGGERQRVAIARALLRHPRFLIFDEATSAIDPASEAALLDRLLLLLDPRPTIVMVAHRRESLSRCSRVIRVDGGKVLA